MVPEAQLIARFRDDLDTLIAPDARIGIAVSGGPDSLALLLLAAAARPGLIEAATVDHGLRPESPAEAQLVASICEAQGIPHAIRTAEWSEKPATAIEERAREVRYALLGRWVEERGLSALATAHHLDDQAETLLMRLNRGSGVRGLAAMRPATRIPGSDLPLLRPLLGWRRSELERICASCELAPAFDPSNSDEQFERVRVRQALGALDWLDPRMLARSAAHLASADEALSWAVEQEWARSVAEQPREICFIASHEPDEIVRRIVARAIACLASEGPPDLRGQELDHLLKELRAGRAATLRGVHCRGGAEWRFIPAPKRTRPADNMR
jgi:tRNA(Ile)-lysidine synthase